METYIQHSPIDVQPNVPATANVFVYILSRSMILKSVKWLLLFTLFTKTYWSGANEIMLGLMNDLKHRYEIPMEYFFLSLFSVLLSFFRFFFPLVVVEQTKGKNHVAHVRSQKIVSKSKFKQSEIKEGIVKRDKIFDSILSVDVGPGHFFFRIDVQFNEKIYPRDKVFILIQHHMFRINVTEWMFQCSFVHCSDSFRFRSDTPTLSICLLLNGD